MARRINRLGYRRGMKSGINPASILRPRKGITALPSNQPLSPAHKKITPKKLRSLFPLDLDGSLNSDSIQEPVVEDMVMESSDIVNPIYDTVSDILDVSVPPSKQVSSLPYVRNPYPTQIGTNPSPNYTRVGNKIKLTGKYDQNYITFNNDLSLDAIIPIGNCDNITFIIQFTGCNRLYTSSLYKRQLQIEMNSNNPYISKETVSVVLVNENTLDSYNDEVKFKVGEAYAETEVTQNLGNSDPGKIAIVKHINWMISSDQNLVQSTILGNGNVNSDTDEESPTFLGFDHEPQLDLLAEGGDGSGISISPPISVDIGSGISSVPTQGDSDNLTSSPPINNLYPPFGVPGKNTKEKRAYQGTTYEWNAVRKGIFGRRGKDNGTWMKVNSITPTESTTPIIPLSNFDIDFSKLGPFKPFKMPQSSGTKIICGELYRQGFLSEEVWEADQEFGKLLFKTHPRIMLGYTLWARNVVKYMKENPNHTKYLYRIFKPWTEQMAYTMGISNKYNIVGSVTQKIGFVYSLIVYKFYQIKWNKFRLTI